MKKIVFEIDMAELTLRLIETALDIQRPQAASTEDALKEFITMGDEAAPIVEMCKRQAEVCWQFVSETMTAGGNTVQ